ncbi:MAG: hypothetical protein ACP5HK_02405 [Acidilobus sp.]
MSSEIPGGGPYKAAIGSHEVITTESLRSLRRVRSSYCSGDLELCQRYVSLIDEAGVLIARARLDEMTSEGYSGVDAGFIKAQELLRDLYGKYVSGSLVSSGEKVLVMAKSDIFTSEGHLIMTGDLWYADVREAAGLYVMGVVEPVMSWPEAVVLSFGEAGSSSQQRL